MARDREPRSRLDSRFSERVRLAVRRMDAVRCCCWCCCCCSVRASTVPAAPFEVDLRRFADVGLAESPSAPEEELAAARLGEGEEEADSAGDEPNAAPALRWRSSSGGPPPADPGGEAEEGE